MCDFCGCPAIDPFSILTDDHQTLLLLADAFGSSGDPRDLDALRVTWDDHRTQERAATEQLAASLSLDDILEIGHALDAPVDALLGPAEPDARELRFVLAHHVDGYEFEVFPALVLPADQPDLDAAARRAAEARAA